MLRDSSRLRIRETEMSKTLADRETGRGVSEEAERVHREAFVWDNTLPWPDIKYVQPE